MSAASSMFLALTPTMQHLDKDSQLDKGNHLPSPIDHVTLNLAVESLSYHFVSGDTLGPAVNGLKAASVDHEASSSQGTGTPAEESNTKAPPNGDIFSDNAPSVENDAIANPSNGVPTKENKAKKSPVDNIPTDKSSIKDEATISLDNGVPAEGNQAKPSPVTEQPTDIISLPSVGQKIDDPVLPPVQNSNQDAVATTTLPPQPQTTDFPTPATILKRRLEKTNDLIVCPGVYDGFSARIALSVGCDAMYMTGAGTTASRLGQPDLGLAQLADMRAHADMIANLDPHGTPVIADMDTGYGGPNTIALAVQQYIRANVAGFHIEDQVLTKRCGHLSGKKVVSAEVFLSRIRAARNAIDKAHSDIVLIARTDALQQLGYDECIARLHAARALGADVGLLEGFRNKEQAARAVKEFAPWPLLLNIVENGHSPLITVDEAREMGFRIMIFSFAGLAPAYLAIRGAYEKLKNEGVTGIQGSGVTPRGIFEVCGLSECMRIDEDAGGEDFKGGV